MPEDEKTKEFLNAYGKLREEYRRDFVAIPTYQPNENGSWDLKVVTQVISIDTDQLTPSPFIA